MPFIWLLFFLRTKQTKCELISCLLSWSTIIATSKKKDSGKYWWDVEQKQFLVSIHNNIKQNLYILAIKIHI